MGINGNRIISGCTTTMMMKKKTIQTVIRWVVIILLAGVSYHLLNYAIFAAWVSGGPPNEYPEVWSYMSLKSFCFGVSAGLFSIIAFLANAKEVSKIKRITCYILALTAFISFVLPFGYKHIKIDSCLDSGGRWEKRTFKCIK